MWTGGAARILNWLATFGGHGWQERWVAAAGDDFAWADQLVAADISDRRGPERSRDELLRGLRALLYLRAIRPGYMFFNSYKPTMLYDRVREVIDPEAFSRCYEAAQKAGASAGRLNDAMTTLVRMVLHTGTMVDGLRATDFLEMRDEYRRAGQPLPAGSVQAWDILRSVGVLSESTSFSAVLRRRGQPSTAELVDSYRLACRPVRDVLVRYLDQRRPPMDFSSFRSVVTVFGGAVLMPAGGVRRVFTNIGPTLGAIFTSDFSAWRSQMVRSRVELFEQIRRDRRIEDLSIRELAERHNVHRRTVRQALDSPLPPPFRPWITGCRGDH